MSMLHTKSGDPGTTNANVYSVDRSVLSRNNTHFTEDGRNWPSQAQLQAQYNFCVQNFPNNTVSHAELARANLLPIEPQVYSQQLQPTFARRPYRYQRRSESSRSQARAIVNQRAADGYEEAYAWNGRLLPTKYVCDSQIVLGCGNSIDGNQYSKLYHDNASISHNSYMKSGIARSAVVLSPPLDDGGEETETLGSQEAINSNEQGEQDEQREQGAQGEQRKPTFLPSPNSNCSSPNTKDSSTGSRLSSVSISSPGISKSRRLKRFQKKGHHAKTRPQSVLGVVPDDLNEEDTRIFEGIYERQFDVMCRTVISGFNAQHNTQIGADLLLYFMQNTDLTTLKHPGSDDSTSHYTPRSPCSPSSSSASSSRCAGSPTHD